MTLRLSAVTSLVCLTFFTNVVPLSAQRASSTSKAIFLRHSQSVVKVVCPPLQASNFPGQVGSGFFISPNGLVLTAGHVIEMSLPNNRVAPCPDLRVVLPDGRPLAAELASGLSEESVRHDYALLTTRESGTPFLHVGSWTDVKEGDDLTIIGYALGTPTPLLILGTVAGRLAMPSPVGGESVNAIFFQSPANVGLSGSPVISNTNDKVVGIVSSKLVGLSPELESLRQWLTLNPGSGITVGGVEIGPSFLKLLSLLNERLITGMGGAVAVDYAKAAIRVASSGVAPH